MWHVQVKQTDMTGDDWLPAEKFETVEQVTGYMWRVANFLVPDVEDTLIKGGNPVVNFKVKWVPNE